MIPQELWERAVISRWRIVLLRLLFPRRNVVQIRKRIYLLRVPQ